MANRETKKTVHDIIGSIEFRKFYDSILQSDPRKNEFLDAFKILQENCLQGTIKYLMIVGPVNMLENME